MCKFHVLIQLAFHVLSLLVSLGSQYITMDILYNITKSTSSCLPSLP